MDDQEIIAKLLEGYSLRTFMNPDPALPSNSPEHEETYDLPHVIINGGIFWAKTITGHLMASEREAHGNVAFCYTNYGDFFMSFSPTIEKGAYVMDIGRYKKHEWVLKKNYKLVWDSEKDQPADVVGREIDAAAILKIAMLDSEDIWNIHPVDLPMYFPDQGTFELKTVSDRYAMGFRKPRELLQYLESPELALRENISPSGTAAILTLPSFPTYYRLRSDGTYSNFFDIPRQTQKSYKALRVYSDNL